MKKLLHLVSKPRHRLLSRHPGRSTRKPAVSLLVRRPLPPYKELWTLRLRPVSSTLGMREIANRILTISKSLFRPPRPRPRPPSAASKAAASAIATVVAMDKMLMVQRWNGRLPGIHPWPGPTALKKHMGMPLSYSFFVKLIKWVC